MNELIDKIFGEGRDLNALQMSSRAFVMFFITLLLIRITGMRAFGTKSAFDNIIVIMLGAILSRAVVGVSPFFPTIAGGLVLALVHKGLAFISIYSSFISHFVKTNDLLLYKNGKLNEKNMKRCNLSMGDLMSGVGSNENIASLEEAEEVYMERTGQISVVKKLTK
jgi:uncharacterized membrane protein YcaP (DUF421 family)